MNDTVVAIVSGGMDSTTLAHHLIDLGEHPLLLSIDYGQRHRKEIYYAMETALHLNVEHRIVDLTSVTDLLTGSALTDPSVDVPDGHYTDNTMRATVVPNRNAMMLDVAVAIAVARGARAVATAVHAGDHAIYPDCRPLFIEAYQRMVRVANEGFSDERFTVMAPFVNISKADIAMLGGALGVDWSRTWSCYKGERYHCGTCGTCVERREAFKLAGLADPTVYAPATSGRS